MSPEMIRIGELTQPSRAFKLSVCSLTTLLMVPLAPAYLSPDRAPFSSSTVKVFVLGADVEVK